MLRAHAAFIALPSGSTSDGPPKDVTAGALPTNFSICTRQDIAALLSIPTNTVKTRVFYAKQQLKRHLERLGQKEPIR